MPNVPTIIVEYYEDEADTSQAKRRYVCSSISEAVMAIGMIERHEHMATEEEIAEARSATF